MKSLIELKNAANEARASSDQFATALVTANRACTAIFKVAQRATKSYEAAEAALVDMNEVAATAKTAAQSAWNTYIAAFQIESDAADNSILTAGPLEIQS